MSCGVGGRSGSDPELLWHRLAAAAPIQPLAWELPCAEGGGPKKTTKTKTKTKKTIKSSGRLFSDSIQCHLSITFSGSKST